MVWRSPDEIERVRQGRGRAAVVWGLFALLLLAAAGMQWRGGVALSLGPRVTAGALSAATPAGWRTQTDAGVPRILAQEPDEKGKKGSVSLTVTLLPDAGETGPDAYFEREFPGALDGVDGVDAGEPVSIAGRPGVMVELAGQVRFAGLGRGGAVSLVVAAAEAGQGRLLVVETRRYGPAQSERDAALVRRVAGEVRVGD